MHAVLKRTLNYATSELQHQYKAKFDKVVLSGFPDGVFVRVCVCVKKKKGHQIYIAHRERA